MLYKKHSTIYWAGEIYIIILKMNLQASEVPEYESQ